MDLVLKIAAAAFMIMLLFYLARIQGLAGERPKGGEG
jgi:hypothetical protein